MSISIDLQTDWTIDRLANLPTADVDEGTRYELIAGTLHVTTQPHEEHQFITATIVAVLGAWNRQSRAGRVYVAPGVVLASDTAVAPDVAWVRRERLPQLRHADGKLHGPPDLVIEVLSPGAENMTRDRVTKLALYDRYGVGEYWIIDRLAQTGPQVVVYRRADPTGQASGLKLLHSLSTDDMLASPLLPGFACPVANLFADE